MVRQLLAAGCDKDKADDWGRKTLYRDRTPLFIAAGEGHEGVVRQLLAAGCDKDKADDRGRTPLHIAAWHGHEEVVRELLDSNCDMSVMNMQMLKICDENIKKLFKEKFRDRFFMFVMELRNRPTPETHPLYDKKDVLEMVMDELLKDLE